MNKAVYTGKVEVHWTSIDGKKLCEIIDAEELKHLAILRVFLRQNELFEMTIKSNKIGFTRTYIKQRINRELDSLSLNGDSAARVI